MSFYNNGADMDERFTECLDFIMWLQRVESVTLLMSLLQKEERKV